MIIMTKILKIQMKILQKLTNNKMRKLKMMEMNEVK